MAVSNIFRIFVKRIKISTYMAAKQSIKEAVKNPTYYGGVDNPYEVIKVCEAWGLDKMHTYSMLLNT